MNSLPPIHHPLAEFNGMVLGLPRAEAMELRAKLGIPSFEEYARLADRMLTRQGHTKAPARSNAASCPQYLASQTISGLALRFNEPIFSYGRGSGSEDDLPLVFAPGCFGDFDDVLLVDDHDWKESGQVLASTTDETLLVQADSRGLAFASSRVLDSIFSRRAVANIQASKMGASVSFVFVRYVCQPWQGVMCQIVLKAKLGHIAITNNPAFRGSWVRVN